MSINIRLPNVTATTAEGKLQQVQSYMYQLVEQLNWALNAIETGSKEVVVLQRKGIAAADKNDPISTFNDIKGLIIKSADIVNAYREQINSKLSGLYVAESDFGKFKEETEKITTETSGSVEDLYRNVQTITSETIPGFEKRIIDVTAYIKSGILEHNEQGIPVYGLEVGQTTEMDGAEMFNRFARFTADRLSFYNQNGDEAAYVSNYKLYIRNAEFLESVKLGGYNVDMTDGIAFKWEGVSE